MTRVEGNKPSLLTDLLGLVKLSLPPQALQPQREGEEEEGRERGREREREREREGERERERVKKKKNFVPDPLSVHPSLSNPSSAFPDASRLLGTDGLSPAVRVAACMRAHTRTSTPS